MIRGEAYIERWPLRVPFVISRSSRTHVEVVRVILSDGNHVGQGECQPNSRYAETPMAVCDLLTDFLSRNQQFDFPDLQKIASPSARNALDCALWDLKAKQAGVRIWDLLGCRPPKPFSTAFTLSLAEPGQMAEAAKGAQDDGKTLLKLKLGGAGDGERVQAVRQAVPNATLIADANEAWTPKLLEEYLPVMAGEGVALLEQPLPAGQDEFLRGIESPVRLCADESCHTAADVSSLVGKYQMVNIKLDKTGGLTCALELEEAAVANGLGVMVGCMLGTSLAMAPAVLLAARARFADLDGPLLLSRDRDHKIRFSKSYEILGFDEGLWG